MEQYPAFGRICQIGALSSEDQRSRIVDFCLRLRLSLFKEIQSGGTHQSLSLIRTGSAMLSFGPGKCRQAIRWPRGRLFIGVVGFVPRCLGLESIPAPSKTLCLSGLGWVAFRLLSTAYQMCRSVLRAIAACGGWLGLSALVVCGTGVLLTRRHSGGNAGLKGSDQLLKPRGGRSKRDEIADANRLSGGNGSVSCDANDG